MFLKSVEFEDMKQKSGTPEEEKTGETLKQQFDLIRALVWKFGPEVVITKEEFMKSYSNHLNIHFQPDGAETVLLKAWPGRAQ